MYAKVSESHQGLSKSSNYYLVIEGNKLVHISRYAVSYKDYGGFTEHIIDLDRIRNKSIIEILVSNSGLFDTVYVYPAEDLPLEYDQRRKEKNHYHISITLNSLI